MLDPEHCQCAQTKLLSPPLSKIEVLMKAHRSVLVFVLCICVFLFSGCEWPTGTPTATPASNGCTPSQLVAPQAHSPSNALVPSLQPSIQWFYPENCEPDAYRLEIAAQGEFNSPSVVVETVGGGQVPWTLAQPLQPATLYQWRVAAEIGSETSEYSPSLSFWTGPLCTANSLTPPLLLDPPYGAVVQDDSPELAWEYTNTACLPEGYHFEVASDPQFSNPSLAGDGPGPWTSFETLVPFVDDCGLYYWWSAAQTGGVLSGHNLSLFYTDFTGSCSQFACDSAQLVPPDLVFPIGGEVVTNIGDPFRFRWQYLDPACIPDGYYIEVYSGVDLASTPPGQGFALDSRLPGWGPLPEMPSYVMLPDCMTFHWHVAALQGTEQGPFSNEATFTTNYSGACGPSNSRQVSLITMACLDNNQMMVTFEFPEDAVDAYEAKVDGKVFDCQLLPGAPRRIFCVGPMGQEDTLVPVQLMDQNSGALLLDQELSILCEKEQEQGGELPACITLNQTACDARSDCKWYQNPTQAGGDYCSTK